MMRGHAAAPRSVQVGQHIISASRRTDIPAFYADWFMARVADGCVTTANPFTGKTFRVSLLPEDVAAIVFWSKNYKPLLPHLDALFRHGFGLYFHFTITGLGRALEGGVPPPERTVPQAHELARRFGSAALAWRFDPVVLTDDDDDGEHVERFAALASALEGAVQRAIISIAEPYRKAVRNLGRSGVVLSRPAPDRERALAARLAAVGAENGIAVEACCCDHLVTSGVRKAHCISAETLSTATGRSIAAPKGATRQSCGCIKSYDIGAYESCAGGCLYCYATTDHARARAAVKAQNVQAPRLAAPQNLAVA